MKNKHTVRKKIIKFPVFMGYKVVIIITNNPHKEVDKISMKHKIILGEDKDYVAVHCWVKDKHGCISYLVFPEDLLYGDIAHECWHCVKQMMCNWAGGSLDNEIVAYHLGYLSQQVYDFWKKKS